MSKPYSNDFPALVVVENLSGLSIRVAARRFRVTVSTAVRWWHRCLQKGNADALKTVEDRRNHKPELHVGRIAGWIDEQPCLSLSEIRARLAEYGPLPAISIFRKIPVGERYTRKETTSHAGGQDRPDVKKLREDWKAGLRALPVGNLVFFIEHYIL